MDKQATIITELQPLPKRHRKRGENQSPSYKEYAVAPRRTGSGLATLGLIIAFVLEFAVGAGATNGRIWGLRIIMEPLLFSTTMNFGRFAHWDGMRLSLLRESSSTCHKPHLSLAAALVSSESFSFDGRTAVASYDRCQKDSKGG